MAATAPATNNRNQNRNGTPVAPSPISGHSLINGPGIGGKPGRSGRKPDSFRKDLKLGSKYAATKLKKLLNTGDPNDPHYLRVAEYAAKYTRTEPPKHTKVSGNIVLTAVRDLPPESY